MLDTYIKQLVTYGIRKDLIKEADKYYCINTIISLYNRDYFSNPDIDNDLPSLNEILKSLTDIAVEKNLIPDSITYRDLFDTKLMGCITPMPSQVQENIKKHYEVSSKAATDFYYNFSCNTNYIRLDRIAIDLKWKVNSDYGELDITINLSIPAKDPKAIAAAKNVKSSDYPKCFLSKENEGYASHVNHPARENHRIIPLTLNGTPWYLQYSPYVYYNEHCIVFNGEHVPMKIDKSPL